ncbi:formate dehydrogenase subunit delta [Tropicimonas sp. IMCC34011]|uniref:formate dehydrogenase subunit delta n=1 Tax=Tropicimonas sp. IMCC34011 TaxID=2248759 RepID=UPI000E2804FA|nr:formate dehydrogenase subunit delta [Tropicimonas sp. IMCC34011]
MKDETLIRMIRQIATAFAHLSEEEAARSIAAHVNDFWEPRMRRPLIALIEAGDDRLPSAVLAAGPDIRRPSEPEAGHPQSDYARNAPGPG